MLIKLLMLLQPHRAAHTAADLMLIEPGVACALRHVCCTMPMVDAPRGERQRKPSAKALEAAADAAAAEGSMYSCRLYSECN